MAVVMVGMSDLVQVLLAAAVVRVQAIVVQDQLAVLVRHVGESTRDSVISLLSPVSGVDRQDIWLEHVHILHISRSHSRR